MFWKSYTGCTFVCFLANAQSHYSDRPGWIPEVGRYLFFFLSLMLAEWDGLLSVVTWQDVTCYKQCVWISDLNHFYGDMLLTSGRASRVFFFFFLLCKLRGGRYNCPYLSCYYSQKTTVVGVRSSAPTSPPFSQIAHFNESCLYSCCSTHDIKETMCFHYNHVCAQTVVSMQLVCVWFVQSLCIYVMFNLLSHRHGH